MPVRRIASALGLLAIALVLSPAHAGAPTDQLRTHIDRVLKVLDDPELKKEGRTDERRATIRAIANEIFDFAAISRRALGRHWPARTPAEREEFVRLFSDLLERAYITKIEGYSGGERIEYLGEIADGDVVTVRTRIVTRQGTDVPVDYRMLNEAGRWHAYDVNIAGVSLVANYRTQFNSIIARASYQELVARLRAKQAERAEPRTTGRPAPVVPASVPLPTAREGP